jgi:hypothetical protein
VWSIDEVRKEVDIVKVRGKLVACSFALSQDIKGLIK